MLTNLKMITLTQQGIILFWALWFTLVALSDLANFLQTLNLLPSSFSFSSNNYKLIVKSLSFHTTPNHRLALWLFGIILLWVLLIAILFWCALFSPNYLQLKISYVAFLLSLAMTACFVLWDELFIQYDLEHGHIIRLGFQLITLMMFMNLKTIL